MTEPIPPPPPPPGGFRMSRRRIGVEIAIGVVFVLAAGLFFASSSAWMASLALHGVPLSIDQKIGALAAKQIQSTKTICTNPRALAYVESLVAPLVAATEGGGDFSLAVVEDPTINAFALPGGYVFVHSGLLEAASSGEEVAGVLAHELSHVFLRHGVHRLLREAGRSVVIGLVLGYGDVAALVEYGESLSGLAYDRAQETEADEMGHRLLREAGISPAGMATFFQRLEREGVSIPAILSTHPDSAERADEALRAAADFVATKTLEAPRGIGCH